ncbi:MULTISPECIES: hypothetical protein [unclassified Marinobacter]|uniref:hypothetical protein n=1 Tax=unclassified Marinobacter TaxID=83889 RepID=UPI00126886B4|nr:MULTISPECIES: hypothetical protein [unclassified Marinobacter]QFS87577.1 hypothetical protein FIV08_12160 [Marinobacter sp. THAF197a]QFT51362.1 hypothetical protein FIU96_12075 [Marinobacter sp. THAF39]
MKITPDHYQRLILLLLSVVDKPDAAEYKAQGLSPVRYRWDWLWAIPLADRQPWFDEVYQYANDDHIDTALKNAVKSFGIEYI